MRRFTLALAFVAGSFGLPGVALGQLNVVVFDDPAYVKTGGGPTQESDTVQASLALYGHNVSTFIGTAAVDWATALAGQDAVVIPEQMLSLGPALSPAAIAAIQDFVRTGRVLIVHGSFGRDVNFLYTVFGFSAENVGTGATGFLTAAAVGTRFESGPASIPDLSLTGALTTASLPPGSVSIYEEGANSWVAVLAYGLGEVVFLGWDWWDAQPLGTADGGWLQILDSAVRFVPDFLAAAMGAGGPVQRFDGTTGAYDSDFVLSSFVRFGLTYGPDGDLYATNFFGNVLERYDGETGAFLGNFATTGMMSPMQVIFGPDGHLYVGNYGNNSIRKYDGATGEDMGFFVDPGAGGLAWPTGMTFGPDGNLYVSSRGTNTVKRYDGLSGIYIDDFATEMMSFPRGLEFSPYTGNLLVCQQNTDEVLEYDAGTGALVGLFILPGPFFNSTEMIFGRDGDIYVSTYTSTDVYRFDGMTGASLGVFATRDDPQWPAGLCSMGQILRRGNWVGSADLAVTKTVDNATPNEGDTIVYTVTVTNNGPHGATTALLADVLPAGVTYVLDTPTKGSYDPVTGVWTIGGMPTSGKATLDIAATVDSGSGGSTIVNTTSDLCSAEFDPSPVNNVASAAIAVQLADLAVTKTVDNANPNEGETIVYTVNLTNNGPDGATNVALTDMLPGGVTFASAAPTQGSYNSGTGLWTAGTVASATSPKLSITVTVDAGTGGAIITNTASVLSADQADHVSGNDVGSVGISVRLADLGVTKTVDNATPPEGETIVYTVTVTNNGPLSATNGQLTDILPTGVTYVSGVASKGAYISGTGVWNFGVMGSGTTETLDITVTVDAATAGSTITNTTSGLTADEADHTPGNDVGSADIYPQEAADLAVTKTVDDAEPDEGATVVYTVTVTNNGPYDATNARLTDLLPAGVTYVSDAPSQGSYDSGTGIWTTGTLASGESATLDITVTVDSSAAGTTITNTTSALSADQGDIVPGNDAGSVDINPQEIADLAVTKDVDNPTPDEGGTIVYTVAVTNIGPYDATNVELTDALPAGVSYISDSPSQGSYNSGTGVWTIGVLAAFNNATLDITAMIDSGTAAMLITNATSSLSADLNDPNSANNVGSTDIYVRGADLDVAKTVDDSTPEEGKEIVFTITVTNNGPDEATNAELTDELPAGVTYVSDAPSQGSYDSGTGIWTIGTLANGESATLDITVTVDPGTVNSTITNATSALAADQADATMNNNVGTVDIQVSLLGGVLGGGCAAGGGAVLGALAALALARRKSS